MTALNQHGDTITPGPYIPSTATCDFCQQALVWSPDADDHLTYSGERCTPDARKAKCAWGTYLINSGEPIDPLTLSGHDGICQCRATISHSPRGVTPYPFPERTPWHCGEPARLTPERWLCRGRIWRGDDQKSIYCEWSVPVSSA